MPNLSVTGEGGAMRTIGNRTRQAGERAYIVIWEETPAPGARAHAGARLVWAQSGAHAEERALPEIAKHLLVRPSAVRILKIENSALGERPN
jgi:hypothetical protein